MKELQENYKAEGKIISMKNMPEIAHPLWKALPDDVKQRYEKMAKEHKKDSKDSVEGKLCSDGTVLAYYLKAEQEEQEKAEAAVKFVERFIHQMGSADEVAESTFIIMLFNVLCCTDEEEYIPLEIGIAKYSIKNGIEDNFHVFIDPGPIPKGYTWVSKDHSDNTHKIPILGFELSTNKYSKICRDIEDFIGMKNKEIIPVFCLEENMKQNQSCLNWLIKKGNYYNLDKIQYYSLTHLLMELRAYVGSAFPSKSIASDILSTHAFDYTPNIRCEFHEDLDNPFCALGCSSRFCFILSDAVCQLYGIDCTSKHLPPRVGDIRDFETYQPKFSRPMPITNVVKIPVKQAKPHAITKIIEKEIADDNLNPKFQTHSEASVSNIFNPNKETASKQDMPFTKNDFPPLNEPLKVKTDNSEMRQPKTMPFVLSRGLCLNQDKRFASISLGRGIGRGKQIV